MAKSKSIKSGCPTVSKLMFPENTNAAGNVSGSAILGFVDEAGVVAAREICSHRIVTVSVKEVVFQNAVHVGDVLVCWSRVTRVGTTSITVEVLMEARRRGQVIPVTQTEVVCVAVGDDERPIPVATGLISEEWKKKLSRPGRKKKKRKKTAK